MATYLLSCARINKFHILSHENIFFKVFCSKVRQKISNIWNYLTFEFDIPKFDLIWIWHFYIGLSLKLFEFDHHEFDLIWIWEKTFEAFPISHSVLLPSSQVPKNLWSLPYHLVSKPSYKRFLTEDFSHVFRSFPLL